MLAFTDLDGAKKKVEVRMSAKWFQSQMARRLFLAQLGAGPGIVGAGVMGSPRGTRRLQIRHGVQLAIRRMIGTIKARIAFS
jgi:hypothetical protein